jgi:hypothetical protein
MTAKLKRILDLVDERHEVLAWVLLALDTGLLVGKFIDGTVWLGGAFLAVVTMLGVRRFKGLRGPGGIGVDDE